MSEISRNVELRFSNLNETQQSAVNAIVQGWQGRRGEFILPIVEGPPGTGKTTVGVIASSRYALEGRRPQIAYLAYTHFAADRALEAFIELGFTPDQVLRVIDRGRRQQSQFYVAFNQPSDLTPNQHRRLRNTPILISTVHGSKRIFDVQTQSLIIVDEFSQVSPPLYFSTISKVRRSERNLSGYILLGDPNQLPVITSQPLLRPNIGIFVFTRRNYEPHQLNIQYRMHERICRVVNALRESLNSYPLETHDSARQRSLDVLGYRWDDARCPAEFQEILRPNNPCVIINTDNLQGEEEVGFEGSKYYPNEASLAARLAEASSNSYKDSNNNPLYPTILSPYSAQVGAIKGYLQNSHLQERCTTIYQAQGREYPCVIISFARKNPSGQIGFLAEPELRAQTYVACSRPMAKLILLFSFSTFQGYRDYDIIRDRCRDHVLIIDADRNWVN
ncbi:MAG: AAA family ATPase [Ignavibacteriae bacterium]|nr:AAA family ATPase [Ignavibacteriota bacterium]